MAILNYTTSISTEKTAGEIQKKLALAGAQAVMSEYDEDGIMSMMSFRIQTTAGLLHFRLPINIDGVHQALNNDHNVSRKFRTHEQAARVAWRIIKDWIEAQIAIIEAGQAEIQEVFLPYAQNLEGQTLYDQIAKNNFKQLTE